MKKLTRVGVWSLAKTLAMIHAIIGLLIGVVEFGMFAFAGVMTIVGGATKAGLITIATGIVLLIAAPIIMAICGLIMGLIVGWLYNRVAKRFGGIQIELT
jgi:hypothetical protein